MMPPSMRAPLAMISIPRVPLHRMRADDASSATFDATRRAKVVEQTVLTTGSEALRTVSVVTMSPQ
jgi:hypothetical protein